MSHHNSSTLEKPQAKKVAFRLNPRRRSRSPASSLASPTSPAMELPSEPETEDDISFSVAPRTKSKGLITRVKKRMVKLLRNPFQFPSGVRPLTQARPALTDGETNTELMPEPTSPKTDDGASFWTVTQGSTSFGHLSNMATDIPIEDGLPSPYDAPTFGGQAMEFVGSQWDDAWRQCQHAMRDDSW